MTTRSPVVSSPGKRPPARPRHLKLAFTCYGLSVCAHAAVALACVVSPMRVVPSRPGGAAVVMQVSAGTPVTMPFMKPMPGASEQGNPDAQIDDDLPPAVLPEGVEQADPETDAAANPPTTDSQEAPATAPQEPPALAQAEPTPPDAARPDDAQARAQPEQQPAPRPTPDDTEPTPTHPLAQALAEFTGAPLSALLQQHAEQTPPARGRDSPAIDTAADNTAPPREQTDPPDTVKPDDTTPAPTPQVAQGNLDTPSLPADDAPPQPDPPQQPPTPPTTASTDNTDAANDPGRVFAEAQVDQPIRFDQQVRPTPSALSRRHKESGTVVVLIRVDATGELAHVEVLNDAGHPRLVDAALRALRRSTFTPATREDEPVSSTRRIEYRF